MKTLNVTKPGEAVVLTHSTDKLRSGLAKANKTIKEFAKSIPQTIWVVGDTYDDDLWMAEGFFDTEQEAIDCAKENEFVAKMTFGERLPENVRDIECIYWPHRETKEEGMVKLEELRKVPVEVDLEEEEQLDAQDEVVDDLLAEKEPATPKGYGELKVGMEGKLNGVPVKIRKITRKDIILRPLNRSIRDEHGMMVSFEEGK